MTPWPAKPLFLHVTMVTLVGTGPAGWWLEGVGTGVRYLIPTGTGKPLNHCLNGKPVWGEDPCSVCGWTSNLVIMEELNGSV